MSIEKWMQLLSSGILAASALYLIARITKQFIVQRRSYQALPFDASPVEAIIDELREDNALDRESAAMLGLAIGDALGMPRESLPVWLSNLRFGRTPSFSRGIIRFMRRRGPFPTTPNSPSRPPGPSVTTRIMTTRVSNETSVIGWNARSARAEQLYVRHVDGAPVTIGEITHRRETVQPCAWYRSPSLIAAIISA